MKIIYKKSVFDKLTDACIAASRDQKEIEKIVLTGEEVEEIKRTPYLFMGLSLTLAYGRLPKDCKIMGVRVESEVA